MASEKIVFVRETTVSSILQDVFTFGTIVFSFWFNFKFIGGNDALDVLLFICFFLFGIGRAQSYKKLKELAEDKK